MRKSGLLTICTVIGVAVTGLLSFRAGKKIKEENVDLKDLNNLKSVVPAVAPAVVAGAATMVSAVTAHKIDGKAVAVATATSLASLATVKHYENEIKEFVGPVKYDEFKKKVAKKIEQNAPFAKEKKAETLKVDDHGEAEVKFMLDLGNGKPAKFASTWYKVLTAESKCQELLTDPEFDEATIADLKDALGLEPEEDDLWSGWDSESVYSFASKSLIAFEHQKFTTVDGETCFVISTPDTPSVFLYDSTRRQYMSKAKLLKAWQEGVITSEEASEKH